MVLGCPCLVHSNPGGDSIMGAAFSVPLSDEQVLFFKTFGYLVFNGFFTAPRAGDDPPRVRLQAGGAVSGTAVRWQPPLLGAPARRRHAVLFRHARRQAISPRSPASCTATTVLGMNTDGNRYTGNTRWHPDTGSIHQYGVKVCLLPRARRRRERRAAGNSRYAPLSRDRRIPRRRG